MFRKLGAAVLRNPGPRAAAHAAASVCTAPASVANASAPTMLPALHPALSTASGCSPYSTTAAAATSSSHSAVYPSYPSASVTAAATATTASAAAMSLGAAPARSFFTTTSAATLGPHRAAAGLTATATATAATAVSVSSLLASPPRSAVVSVPSRGYGDDYTTRERRRLRAQKSGALISIPAYVTARDLAFRLHITLMQLHKAGAALYPWWPRASERQLKKDGFSMLKDLILRFDECAEFTRRLGYKAVYEHTGIWRIRNEHYQALLRGRRPVSAARSGARGEQLSSRGAGAAAVAEEERPVRIQPKQPVVCIVGHVDHGKTTLLDTLRGTSIAAAEDAGITQDLYSHQAPVGDEIVALWGAGADLNSQSLARPANTDRRVAAAMDGYSDAGLLSVYRNVTFLDTPGHASFFDMRENAVLFCDLVLLVVSAVDGVCNQTLESISYVKEFKTPVLVVLTKVDLPEANVNRVVKQLKDAGLAVTPHSEDKAWARIVPDPEAAAAAVRTNNSANASASAANSPAAAKKGKGRSSLLGPTASSSSSSNSANGGASELLTAVQTVPYVAVSALEGLNMASLRASLLKTFMTVRPSCDILAPPVGLVLEGKNESGGRGRVLRVLLYSGLLERGNPFVSGILHGSVRDIRAHGEPELHFSNNDPHNTTENLDDNSEAVSTETTNVVADAYANAEDALAAATAARAAALASKSAVPTDPRAAALRAAAGAAPRAVPANVVTPPARLDSPEAARRAARPWTRSRLGTQLAVGVPGVPLEVTGCSVLPHAGDDFRVCLDSALARAVADARRLEAEYADQSRFALGGAVPKKWVPPGEGDFVSQGVWEDWVEEHRPLSLPSGAADAAAGSAQSGDAARGSVMNRVMVKSGARNFDSDDEEAVAAAVAVGGSKHATRGTGRSLNGSDSGKAGSKELSTDAENGNDELDYDDDVDEEFDAEAEADDDVGAEDEEDGSDGGYSSSESELGSALPKWDITYGKAPVAGARYVIIKAGTAGGLRMAIDSIAAHNDAFPDRPVSVFYSGVGPVTEKDLKAATAAADADGVDCPILVFRAPTANSHVKKLVKRYGVEVTHHSVFDELLTAIVGPEAFDALFADQNKTVRLRDVGSDFVNGVATNTAASGTDSSSSVGASGSASASAVGAITLAEGAVPLVPGGKGGSGFPLTLRSQTPEGALKDAARAAHAARRAKAEAEAVAAAERAARAAARKAALSAASSSGSGSSLGLSSFGSSSGAGAAGESVSSRAAATLLSQLQQQKQTQQRASLGLANLTNPNANAVAAASSAAGASAGAGNSKKTGGLSPAMLAMAKAAGMSHAEVTKILQAADNSGTGAGTSDGFYARQARAASVTLPVASARGLPTSSTNDDTDAKSSTIVSENASVAASARSPLQSQPKLGLAPTLAPAQGLAQGPKRRSLFGGIKLANEFSASTPAADTVSSLNGTISAIDDSNSGSNSADVQSADAGARGPQRPGRMNLKKLMGDAQ